MALIPDGFRKADLRLRHLPFSDDDAVETEKPWLQTPPEFVIYTRDDEPSPWSAPKSAGSLHATYTIVRDDVVLFGPNHLVDEAGGWNLEAARRPEQYIDFYDSESYRHILKGAKPRITRHAEEPRFGISLDQVHDEEIIHLDHPVFLATPIEPDNWGRWLSTVVPKISRYNQAKELPNYRILCRSSKPWQRRLLELLGSDPADLIDHDPGRTYFCSRVVTTTYSATDITPAASEMAVYRALADRFSENRSPPAERIYVSRATRSARAPNYRVLTNEADLVAMLKSLGFDVIEPETLPFEDQVAKFASANFVVGLGGAGMFNTLFCKPDTKVITIESGQAFIGGHSRMFAAAGLRYGVVFGRPDETDPAPIHKRWCVDTAKVSDAVRRLA